MNWQQGVGGSAGNPVCNLVHTSEGWCHTLDQSQFNQGQIMFHLAHHFISRMIDKGHQCQSQTSSNLGQTGTQ